jgi:hypothetical protein
MAKGAPQGNQNARKEATGRRLVVYLTADDLSLLRYVQEKYEGDTSDAACMDLARKAAKCGINNLLNPEYYEVATRRVLKERKNAMQAQQRAQEIEQLEKYLQHTGVASFYDDDSKEYVRVTETDGQYTLAFCPERAETPRWSQEFPTIEAVIDELLEYSMIKPPYDWTVIFPGNFGEH